jgi:hypothetical protein
MCGNISSGFVPKQKHLGRQLKLEGTHYYDWRPSKKTLIFSSKNTWNLKALPTRMCGAE